MPALEPPSPRGRRRRDELLAAVVDHLLAEGLDGYSLRHVARATGTSHRTLLYYFGSGPELLREALARIRAELLGELTLQDPDAAPATTAMRLLTERSPASRVLLQGLAFALLDPAEYRAIAADWIAAYLPLVERQLPDGLDPEHRADLAALALCALRGALLDVQATGETERAERALRAFDGIVERATRD